MGCDLVILKTHQSKVIIFFEFSEFENLMLFISILFLSIHGYVAAPSTVTGHDTDFTLSESERGE